MRARRRLLQALEEGVLRRLVHRLGVVDDEDPPARLERRPGDLADEVPHLVHPDLGLGPRPAGPGQPPALREDEVGVEAEVPPDVLVGVPVGLAPEPVEPLGLERGGHLPARPALPAGLGDGRPLAQGRLGDGEGQGLLPDALGPGEEHRGRQAVPLERPREDRAHAVVAPHVGEPHRAASPRTPRAASPDHSASNTASSGPRAVHAQPARRLRGERGRRSRPARGRGTRAPHPPGGRAPRGDPPERGPTSTGTSSRTIDVGPQAAGGERGQAVDGREVQAAAVALVGQARLHVAVAEHHPALGQGRAHHLGHVLRPVGEVEEQLRHRGHAAARGVEEHAPYRRPDGRAPGLAGDHDLRAEPRGEPAQLRRLAAALDPLERDERHRAILAATLPAARPSRP